MLILSFEEFNKKYDIDNKAMCNIKIEDICRDISLIPIQIVTRDQKPDNINDNNFNVIFNLHPTDGTHWVLVIRREHGKTHYFDSSGDETTIPRRLC